MNLIQKILAFSAIAILAIIGLKIFFKTILSFFAILMFIAVAVGIVLLMKRVKSKN